MNIEPLESRIAPASVFKFVDVDGDKVTISSSVGTLDNNTVFLFPEGGVGGTACGGLNLTAAFADANITFSVKKVPGGDGLAHVGSINAVVDLGNVTIKGDLGSITANDVKKLTVRSMGRFGDATGDGPGILPSNLSGSLGALVVAGDMKDVVFRVTGEIGSIAIKGSLIGGAGSSSGSIGSDGAIGKVSIGGDLLGSGGSNSGLIISIGKIGSVTIGGSVIGGGGEHSGRISSVAEIGAVKIKKHVIGGTGEKSGAITTTENGLIASVSIGGVLRGGSGIESGGIFAGDPSPGTTTLAFLGPVRVAGSLLGGSDYNAGVIFSQGAMGSVKIGRDVAGGSGFDSGKVHSKGVMGSVMIGGNLLGGSASDSGWIVSEGAMGAVRIAGDVIGGNATGADLVSNVGAIEGGGIASVTIGGSLIAGIDNSTEQLLRSGAITSSYDIGPIVIKGSMVGTATAKGVAFALIGARGQAVLESDAMTDVAIASVTVGGRMELAKVRAGFTPGNTDFIGTNGNASIGPVKVRGDVIASSIVAGVQDGDANGFGTAGDVVIPGATLTSRIASITIKGIVMGTFAAGDQFGIVARHIGLFQSLGYTAPLTDGINIIQLATYTGDVTIREL